MNRPAPCPAPAGPAAHSPATPAAHWSTIDEAGSVAGLRLVYGLYRLGGRRAFRVLLSGASLWFALLHAGGRGASLDWLRTHARRYPERWGGRTPGRMDVYRHFRAFGETMLDKALAWTETPGEQDFTLVDPELVERTLADPAGQLVIGSHLGNLEYCRAFLGETHARTVNVLVYDKHTQHFVRAMERVSPDSRLNVFQVDELDVPMVLTLKERVARGEWLFIAGDRLPLSGEARTATVDFLGRPAAFPVGPYLLARMLGCPVKLMFSYRMSKGRSHADATVRDTVLVDLQHFSDGIELPRGHRDAALADHAARFAAALEAHAREAPYQWFNFYPFWKSR